jgi:hypothetical protein
VKSRDQSLVKAGSGLEGGLKGSSSGLSFLVLQGEIGWNEVPGDRNGPPAPGVCMYRDLVLQIRELDKVDDLVQQKRNVLAKSTEVKPEW